MPDGQRSPVLPKARATTYLATAVTLSRLWFATTLPSSPLSHCSRDALHYFERSLYDELAI